jgi:PAS domain S-box-containing protein
MMNAMDTGAGTAGVRILIVEDEIIIARELEARLEGMGHGVAGIAASGQEALALAEETRPDLVLMDIVLKGDIDGIEAAAEIRRRFHLPVIFISAYADRDTLARAKITQPFAYIVKPFSERELAANIEMALYRHGMETRLRKLERWFAAAMEQVPEAVIAADRAGRITVLNRAAEDITAWSKEEALGRCLAEVVRLVGGDGLPLALEALEEGPLVCLANEARLLDRSGREIPVDSSISFVRDVRGRHTGTVAIVRDVSGQRHTALMALNRDVALAATQALTLRGMLQLCAESIVRNLNAAFARVWTLDASGTTLLLQASAGLYTHLDGPHSRVPVGKWKIGRIAEQRRPHLTNDVPHDPLISDPDWAREEGMTAFAGYPLLLDDRVLGVLAMFSRHELPATVVDALGSVSRSVAVAVERKQSEESLRAAQEALQESENRLRQIAETSSAVLWLRDARAMECLYVSSAYEALWRRSCQSLYEDSASWTAPIHPDDLPGVRDDLARAVEGESVVLRFRLVHADGVTRFIEDHCLPIRGPDGEVVRLAGYAEDVTERHLLEDQYRHAQKMEAVGQLAGGVAHDFNNLLTVINGCSEIVLQAPGLDSATRDLIAEIGHAGQRAAGLTRQLLAFSRKQVLAPRLLNLNALVREQENLLRRLIGEDVQLTTLLHPDVEEVKADRGQLEQVIANLAVNARHAMPKGGQLTIETANVELDESYVASHADVAAGEYVLLAVSDTGCGMSPEIRERIFEPFFTTKGPTEGTGLGLATAYGIVKQSGGHIAAYSEVDMGTTFKVYLPRMKGLQPAEPVVKTAPRPTPTGSETILLVEDEDAVRAIARHVLTGCGYQVLDAASGVEALRCSRRHDGPIHLLITDVVMPEITGRALAQELVGERPDIRVLYMSGYTDDAVIRHGVLHAETPFLQKPFMPQALAAKVRDVLNQRGECS